MSIRDSSPTLYRSWKGLIRSIRDRRGLYKSFQGKFGTLDKDPFYTFPWFFRQNSILQDLIGKEQCHPILFIRNGGKAKHDKPHYDLRNKDIRKLIKSALEHNVTIGLHSSYQAGTTPSLIRKEKTGLEDHIGKNVRFNRHHFLAIREPEDMDQIEAAGVTDDFTMGYADAVSYTHLTSYTFLYPFGYHCNRLCNSTATSLTVVLQQA